MRELVRQAERHETTAKDKILRLLQQRSEMYEGAAVAAEDSSLEAEYKARSADAARQAEAVQRKFARLRGMCISAEQVSGQAAAYKARLSLRAASLRSISKLKTGLRRG